MEMEGHTLLLNAVVGNTSRACAVAPDLGVCKVRNSKFYMGLDQSMHILKYQMAYAVHWFKYGKSSISCLVWKKEQA